VDLPQRTGPIHGTTDNARNLFGQLIDHARLGQLDLPDMEVEIKVRVVDPVRMIKPQRHLDKAAAQWFELADHGGVLGMYSREWVVVCAGSLEDHQARDVPKGCRCLQIQKGRVQAAELFHEWLPTWSAFRLRRAA